jgi:hypothetical protein
MTDKPGWVQRAKDLFGGSAEDKDEKGLERSLHKLGVDIIKDQKLEHREKQLMRFEDRMSEPIKTDDLTLYVLELKDRQDTVNHALYEISAPFGRGGDIPRFSKMFHGWGRLNASAQSWIIRTVDIVAKVENGKDKPNATVKPKQKPEAKDSKSEEKSGVAEFASAVRENVQEAKKDGRFHKDQETTEEDEDKSDDIHIEQLLRDVETETIDPKMLVQCLHDDLQKHIWKDAFQILGQCFLDRDVSPRSATVIQNVNAQREREDMRKEPDFS